MTPGMWATRNKRNNRRNDAGEIGIGTMIVFIAAVIVAAVAAAVLIDTAGNLQRKASETGGETTQEVAANMFVRDIVGYDASTDDDLDEVYIYLSLAPGADPIDLNQSVLRWKHSSNMSTVQVGTTTTDCDATGSGQWLNLGSGFCVRKVDEASGDGNKYVLSGGDRVRVEVHLGATETVGTRADVDLLMIPETGSPVEAGFSTPATFGAEDYLTLV